MSALTEFKSLPKDRRKLYDEVVGISIRTVGRFEDMVVNPPLELDESQPYTVQTESGPVVRHMLVKPWERENDRCLGWVDDTIIAALKWLKSHKEKKPLWLYVAALWLINDGWTPALGLLQHRALDTARLIDRFNDSKDGMIKKMLVDRKVLQRRS